jgi:hypothetical protein
MPSMRWWRLVLGRLDVAGGVGLDRDRLGVAAQQRVAAVVEAVGQHQALRFLGRRPDMEAKPWPNSTTGRPSCCSLTA